MIGIIGKSGKFYSCESCEHIKTQIQFSQDAPFICCYENNVTFDEYYYRCVKPTKEQFESLMTWCTTYGVTFEEAIDCYDSPWQDFRG